MVELTLPEQSNVYKYAEEMAFMKDVRGDCCLKYGVLWLAANQRYLFQMWQSCYRLHLQITPCNTSNGVESLKQSHQEC